MERHHVRHAVSNFLSLLETGGGSDDENIQALHLILDQLALAAHIDEDTFEEGHPDPPAQDYHHFRVLAGQRFPSFGYYNLPNTVTGNIMQTELVVGDAIDDLADIACDLAAIVWCWQHTSEGNALWHFQFGFEHHFGTHLRNLQWYIHAFKRER